MLIDTHCHLDANEFSLDRTTVCETAQALGVDAIIVPAIHPQNFQAVTQCCQTYPICYPAYGTHPLYAEHVPDSVKKLQQQLVTAMASDLPPVAIGEIGLDYFVDGVNYEAQRTLFNAQLDIAREFELPVLLHVRRAVDAVLQAIKRSGVRSGIAHAFNGSLQQAEAFIQLGFKLGFGGAMTYERATKLRHLAQNLPLEAIVLETDAPDMAPRWIPHQRNAPAHLPRIAEELAKLRGQEIGEIARITHENARHILSLYPRHANR